MSFTVFLVDDDPGVLQAFSRLLRSAGYEARTYLSAKDFLTEHDASVPGCVVLDLAMPDIDGLSLQEKLRHDGAERPIIFLTGAADVAASVQAMKAGAVDFLTKPTRSEQFFAAVERARKQDTKARQLRDERLSLESQLAKLTPRERDVLAHVLTGSLNKQTAASLGTSEKTIKVHRGRIMAKLKMRSVAELVRFAERVGFVPVPLAKV